MWDIQDLEQAYQVARDTERFLRIPIYCRPEAPRTSTPNSSLGPNQLRPNWPSPNAPLARRGDKDKAPIRPNSDPNACFKCHQVGHFATNCPHRALLVEDLGENEIEAVEPLEEEVYQAEDNLADKYEGEEDFESPDLLGVVRCILTQAKTQEDWHRTSIL